LPAALAIVSSSSALHVAERIAIARLGKLGDGICDTSAGPLYVSYALPGETVAVEPWPGHADRRHLLEVESASPDRVAPICAHFGVCGGCALQHWELRRYRQWKRELVVETLARVGLDTTVDDFVDAHGEGRRRAVFHARRGPRELLEVGFSARKSHRVVAIDHCPVLAPGLAGAITAAWAIAEAIAGTRKPLDIQVTASEGGLDVDVRGSGPLSAPHMVGLAELARRHRLARLTRHGEIVAKRAAPTVRIGRASVELPPGAFLQATAAGEAALARLVTMHCAGATRVADLFCGIGPFALRLAERARVCAVDQDSGAMAALQKAAARTERLKPIDTQVRDLLRRPLTPQELKAFDAVVFDPPRQGAEAQARGLAGSAVPAVIAVSCNPTTFARDARILVDGGYSLRRVTPVDQFLYSIHVEVVALFERGAHPTGLA
jgi:23S rRNA (uracil1939-C5)-methyltransferase